MTTRRRLLGYGALLFAPLTTARAYRPLVLGVAGSERVGPAPDGVRIAGRVAEPGSGLTALVNDPSVDALMFTGPGHSEVRWARPADEAAWAAAARATLARGRHLYLDAGLVSSAEWPGLADIARRTGATLMPGYWRMERPHWQRALATVRSGALGAVRSVAVRLPDANIELDHWLALAGSAIAPGGAVLGRIDRAGRTGRRTLIRFPDVLLAIDRGAFVSTPAVEFAGDDGWLVATDAGLRCGTRAAGSSLAAATFDMRAASVHARDPLKAFVAALRGTCVPACTAGDAVVAARLALLS